ncbi:Transcription factor grauzone-like Protein [Tribolium castaneum]|uniref:Protein hunchback n=1 Tax=Tribolium castaneum TaxID=7070 RepID=A0A139WGX9_TRICA|nr:Transcription factor grauzone-like Protein [Tribolium castaneum]
MELYKCKKCTFRTKLQSTMKNHSTIHTIGAETFDCSSVLEPYKCHKCPTFVTPFLSQLRHHIVQGHTSQRVKLTLHKCPRCDFKSFSRFLFSKHLKSVTHERNDFYECKSCDYVTRSVPRLRRHVIARHTADSEIEWFQCAYCPFKGKLRGNLSRHVQIHDPDFRFACQFCDYKAKRSDYLRQHLYGRHMSKILRAHSCDHCDFKSIDRARLKSHQVAKHTVKCDFDYLQCSQCQYKTPFKFVLNRHVTSKHGPDRLKCDQCEFVTKYKLSLRNHILLKHTENAQMFSCDKCDYKSKIKSTLSNHRRLQHGNVPMFQCDVCDYRTNQKISLLRHFRALHNRAHKCRECNLSFETNLELTAHKKNEHWKGVKVYKCKLCDFESIHPGSISNHKYLRHSDKWFCCEHCDYKTKMKLSFAKHVRARHCD